MPPESENAVTAGALVDSGPRLRAPLGWRLKKLWRVSRMPLIAAAIVLGAIYVPRLEARNQQENLAKVFFAECRQTLKDTEALPKTPDEALQEAIHKASVTQAAVLSWAPLVSSEVRNGEWVARIEFSPPGGYVLEQTIGPSLGDQGYDTPSPGP